MQASHGISVKHNKSDHEIHPTNELRQFEVWSCRTQTEVSCHECPFCLRNPSPMTSKTHLKPFLPAHDNPHDHIPHHKTPRHPKPLLRLRLQTELHDTQSDHHMHKACELNVGLSANQSTSHQTHHIALQTNWRGWRGHGYTESDLFQRTNLVEALVAPTATMQKCTRLRYFWGGPMKCPGTDS